MTTTRKACLPGLIFAGALLLLGACGREPLDRGLSGAGLGAAAGAGVAALTEADLLTAGLRGAVAGGAAGALIDSGDVNLGDPLWEDLDL